MEFFSLISLGVNMPFKLHNMRSGLVDIENDNGQVQLPILTDTTEGFWSLLKRVWYGLHHHHQTGYTPLYVAEQCYKYNCREINMFWKFISVFWFFLMLLGIFGCGGDEDTENPSEKIVGSWELITINGKSPKTDAQQDFEDDEGEVVDAGEKLVFGADSSFFREIVLVLKQRVKNSTIIPGLWLDFTMRLSMSFTLNGTYVISDQVIEFIQGDRVNVDFDFSIDDAEAFPELEEREQEIKELVQESARELEQELVSEFALELDTYTFGFEGDSLTLMQKNTNRIYRKR